MTETTEVNGRRLALLDGLRDCIAFLEAHPTVPIPYDVTLNTFVDSREKMSEIARAATWEKHYSDDYFWLTQAFGPVRLDINTRRETVCRKVVKGTKTLAAVPERVVEDVEWVCDEPLLAVSNG
jgi:hypothetical protein